MYFSQGMSPSCPPPFFFLSLFFDLHDPFSSFFLFVLFPLFFSCGFGFGFDGLVRGIYGISSKTKWGGNLSVGRKMVGGRTLQAGHAALLGMKRTQDESAEESETISDEISLSGSEV